MLVLLKKTITSTQVFYTSKQNNSVVHNCSIDTKKFHTELAPSTSCGLQIYSVCMAMFGERLGGFRDVLCEKLLEASPVSKEVNANQFQDGHTAGQNRVHQ